MATAARRIVATSEGGGRPSRQSRPERLAYYQCPFMLPLEVVVNGADRHALLARCQSESVLVGGNGDKLRPDSYGAHPSAGDGRRWRRRSGPFPSATDAKFPYCLDRFV